MSACQNCGKELGNSHYVHPTELMGQFCLQCYKECEKQAIEEGKRIRGLDELNNPVLANFRIEMYEKEKKRRAGIV